MKAYCYASGLIEFGARRKPGAELLAEGPIESQLREFIESRARHGYRTELVDGRPTKIKGSDTLLVPGVPEARDHAAAWLALVKFKRWIGRRPPAGITVAP